MPDYRRMLIPGGTYFFTVNLRDRGANHLTTEIDAFRAGIRDEQDSAAHLLLRPLRRTWPLPEQLARRRERTGGGRILAPPLVRPYKPPPVCAPGLEGMPGRDRSQPREHPSHRREKCPS